MNKILFVDMDGTLARFYEPEDWTAFRCDPEYFVKLRPYTNLVLALSRLMRDGYTVIALSAVEKEIRMSSILQKNQWLATVFSNAGYRIVPEALYPPTGESKISYVRSIFGDISAVLLDDYTKNLQEWTSGGGIAIKAINEINGFGGKFAGMRIDIINSSEEELYEVLLKAIQS